MGSFKPKGNSSEWEWKTNTNKSKSGTRNKGKAVKEGGGSSRNDRKKEERNSVSMYITNFPPNMESKDLWKTCGEVGTVADVYLARKLSRLGKRFAFVRFLRVQDESELARKLSDIWIGNHHVFATVARFGRKHEPIINAPKPFHQLETMKEGGNSNNDQPKTYKNVVTGMREGVTKVEGKEDRISALSDCLLLEILSRLPFTKDAIRTGTLSKRWENLWTSVSSLIFDHDHKYLPPNFILLVDKTLTQCRQLKLKRFEVYTIDYCQFVGFEWHVNNWIHYAMRCNVEQLTLFVPGVGSNFLLDQNFFTNTCLTDMTLARPMFNPIVAISWKNLRSLCIFEVNLDEDLIENILYGSPLLETLILSNCHGFRLLDITSKSVKNLYFSPDGASDTIEINAPNILSLTIQGNLMWKLLLVNVSSLVEANLYYLYKRTHYGPIRLKEAEEELLKGLILNLLHVKELKIKYSCDEVFSRLLQTKGKISPAIMDILNVLRLSN